MNVSAHIAEALARIATGVRVQVFDRRFAVMAGPGAGLLGVEVEHAKDATAWYLRFCREAVARGLVAEQRVE